MTPAKAEEVAFHPFREDRAAIGQLLFYDPILSGNRNISCATCHHHDTFSADGLSLGIGEGGAGVGTKRTAGEGPDAIRKRVPRNAPALWNLGAVEFESFFHDGRISRGDAYGRGWITPAEEWLPDGLPNLLTVQALFPMTAQFEMAGNTGENEVIGAVQDRIDLGWPILAKRVRTIPAYGDALVAAFDLESTEGVRIEHIAIALADFMNAEWRSLDSPYDAWLAGEGALTPAQERGRELFFGRANCATCHSGPLFTDHGFHALGLPPFGPGRTRRFDPMPRDVGRMAETDDLEDAYKFRTPSLRNVTLTAPYGHNGAYPTLEGIIRHHADPLAALDAWTPQMAKLPAADWLRPIDFVIQQDRREMARVRATITIEPVALNEAEIADLVAFLGALEGGASRHGRLGPPDAVPSGLEVER
ncbi:cytochrome-c peroxidase [Jannaschia seohaensis]|uniref:Cytochrome c peroxidase n=1 Tax=Jannaschia seohaensis TaxID=475081 RepID=A0A2Y9B1L5_9RHOB|nr:cytochrome c peroxidase [Jannaschia seohaensis]PWJ15076.1 cytochrome c peroxidase [Jannaschia seohaensis]SSA49925.1 cytochrome c peroxidase [Jannaschia seohaensis]